MTARPRSPGGQADAQTGPGEGTPHRSAPLAFTHTVHSRDREIVPGDRHQRPRCRIAHRHRFRRFPTVRVYLGFRQARVRAACTEQIQSQPPHLPWLKSNLARCAAGRDVVHVPCAAIAEQDLAPLCPVYRIGPVTQHKSSDLYRFLPPKGNPRVSARARPFGRTIVYPVMGSTGAIFFTICRSGAQPR